MRHRSTRRSAGRRLRRCGTADANVALSIRWRRCVGAGLPLAGRYRAGARRGTVRRARRLRAIAGTDRSRGGRLVGPLSGRDRTAICGLLRVEARQQHSWLQTAKDKAPAALLRLTYLLNPLLPCASPLLAGRWVARLADLLPALEQVAGQARSPADRADRHAYCCFYRGAARTSHGPMNSPAQIDSPRAHASRSSGVLAQLQAAITSASLAGAGGLARGDGSSPVMATWRNRERADSD